MCGARSLEQVALTKAHRPRSAHATGTSFVEANDNALPLRGLVYRAVRLAGRLALTQLRSLAQSSRTVASPFSTYSFLMRQRTPCAVTVVASASLLPFAVRHHCLRVRPVVEVQSTTGDFAGVGQPFSELGKVADHERRH